MRGATIFERLTLREQRLRERFLGLSDRRTALSAYRVWEGVRDFLDLSVRPIDTRRALHYKGRRARAFQTIS